MQNMDFYTGKINKTPSAQFNTQDPEYFTRLAKKQYKEEEKSKKRASRMISLIIALCIVSFTVGLVMGIKFAAGSKKEIVDKDTKRAVTNIGEKVSLLIKEASANDYATTSTKKLFPQEEFPFVIRIGKDFNKSKSHKIGTFLSNKGHTVILSKNKRLYRVYIGPFRNRREAELSLKKIKSNSTKGLFANASIIKR